MILAMRSTYPCDLPRAGAAAGALPLPAAAGAFPLPAAASALPLPTAAVGALPALAAAGFFVAEALLFGFGFGFGFGTGAADVDPCSHSAMSADEGDGPLVSILAADGIQPYEMSLLTATCQEGAKSLVSVEA